MLQGLVLRSLMLCLLLFAIKKGEMIRGLFPQQTHPSGCDVLGFPWLLGAIESCFKGQSLNFMCILCVSSYLVG
jgi:hypothetical protein